MKHLLTLIVLASSLCGCAAHEFRPDVPDGSIDCEKACLNMQEAGCDEGTPTPKQQKPCTSWCNAYHAPENGLEPWAACVAAAGPDPKRIEACDMKCTRK